MCDKDGCQYFVDGVCEQDVIISRLEDRAMALELELMECVKLDVCSRKFLGQLRQAALAYASHALNDGDQCWRAAYTQLAECADVCDAYMARSEINISDSI